MSLGNVDRISQLEAMRLGVDYTFEVKVRGFSLVLRPLAIVETIDVTNRVIDRVNNELKSRPHGVLNPIFEQTMMAIETLMMASTSDVGANDPRITAYVLERCSADELNSIFKEYVAGCDKVNPSLDRMSVDEIELIVEQVKKNPDWEKMPLLPLIGLSHSQLANVALHLLTKGD